MDIPFAVRQFKDNGPSYSSISRFYNETGLFHGSGNTDQIVAGPFQAINSFPSATSAFADTSSWRKKIPVFHPENCKDTINLAVVCPNSAMPTISLSMEAMIKAGAVLAGKSGNPITKMTPLVKNLAKMANKFMATHDGEISCVDDVLPTAFENLAQQAKLEGEKLDALKAELKSILEQIGSMSIALTAPLFYKEESIAAGSGEVFNIAFDPNSCTGCGTCAAHCKNNEVTMEDPSDERLSKMKQQFSLWEQLPDTSGDTITRLIDNGSCDPFAAIMLSRNFYLSMGGSHQWQGMAQRTMLHMVTATAESALQGAARTRVSQVSQLIKDLKVQVQKELASGLPQEDLGALKKAIDKAGSEHIPFDQVIDKVSSEGRMKLMDTGSLNRKLSVLKGLESLFWTLSEGPTGIGRARYGLAIHGEENLQWAQEYPYNPFMVPTVISAGQSSPEMVNGIFQGQQASILNNVKLLRRAALEAKGKYNPVVHDEEIAQLRWSNLSIEEKAQLAPIILVADQNQIIASGAWNKLLLSDNPIKIVALNNGDLPANEQAPQLVTQQASMLISAISLKNAFVLQTASADHSILFKGMVEGLRTNAPALFILNTPDKAVHTDDWKNRYDIASLALNTRAHFDATFKAENTDSFLSNGIDLTTNPDYGKTWKADTEYTPTWADFAFTLNNWVDQFEWIEDNKETVDVATFLSNGKTGNPAISVVSDGELKRYSVSDLVIRTTEAVAGGWRTLQEIAGALTPYPEKLRAEIEAELKAELKAEFDKELASKKVEMDQELKEKEAQQVTVIRQRLKDKLVAMANQGSVKA